MTTPQDIQEALDGMPNLYGDVTQRPQPQLARWYDRHFKTIRHVLQSHAQNICPSEITVSEKQNSLTSVDERQAGAPDIEAFLRKKYIIRADERQKTLGLSYLEAEVSDLAMEITKFLSPDSSPVDVNLEAMRKPKPKESDCLNPDGETCAYMYAFACVETDAWNACIDELLRRGFRQGDGV